MNLNEQPKILENHLFSLYKLLGLEGHKCRIGSLDTVTKEYENVIASDYSEVKAYANRWNGKRNIFIGRARRDSGGVPNDCRVISLDIDPVRPKGEASTDEQHKGALDAGRHILSLYPSGYLASSGNGCLLLYYAPAVANCYEKQKLLIQELNLLVGDKFNVKIDSTAYEEAVIKALGTYSTKGVASLRRVSRFITVPYPPYYTPTRLVEKLSNLENKPVTVGTFTGDPIKRITDAKELLKRLGDNRVESYDDWLKVGMALKEFGIAGLQLWKEWSKRSDKYEEEICEEKWQTFKEKPSVTLSSLAYWAREDSGQLPSNKTIPKDPYSNTESYFSALFAPSSESQSSIYTGLRGLDKALGALPRGEISTFSARSGYGKTTFACTISEHLRKAGRKVLYFSTEMSASYLMHKLVALSCSIPLSKVIAKDVGRYKSVIDKYREDFEKAPILINDSFQPAIEEVKRDIEKYKPDVMIFDHISQIDTNWQNVAEYMRRLKTLTNAEGIVTVVMSMLNEPGRNSKGGENLSIRGDVRGSQETIFLSSIFALLTNPYEVKGNFQPVQVHVAKNRYGISGLVVDLMVDKETSKFMEGTNLVKPEML